VIDPIPASKNSIEERMAKLESKVEELSMACEFFKTYGFSQKEYDSKIGEMKESRK
jgi:hypothetical protein